MLLKVNELVNIAKSGQKNDITFNKHHLVQKNTPVKIWQQHNTAQAQQAARVQYEYKTT